MFLGCILATHCLGLCREISQVPGSLSCLKKRMLTSKTGWGTFTSSCSAPESLTDPFTSCSKNGHCFPSVFPSQALSLLLVDVLSYISVSPSAQHLNKGMERFKNSLKCFGLRKGLERRANVTEECREGRSQKQAAESKSCCFTDNTEAILPPPQCLLQ